MVMPFMVHAPGVWESAILPQDGLTACRCEAARLKVSMILFHVLHRSDGAFFQGGRKIQARLRSSLSQWPICLWLDIDIPIPAVFCLKDTSLGLVVDRFSGGLFFLQKLSVLAWLGGHLRLISL
jgi:hypothetical protein